MLCQFLLYNKVNQLYLYFYPHIPSLLHLPPTLPIPPLQVVTKHRADLPVLCSCFPLASYFTFKPVVFNGGDFFLPRQYQCRDIFGCHINEWNWRCYLGLGMLLNIPQCRGQLFTTELCEVSVLISEFEKSYSEHKNPFSKDSSSPEFAITVGKECCTRVLILIGKLFLMLKQMGP